MHFCEKFYKLHFISLLRKLWDSCFAPRNPRRGFPTPKQSTGLFWLPSCAFLLLGFHRLRSATKGATFGIRKPLKRLERNFESHKNP